MQLYRIDPTQDRRWEHFLRTHPDASVFHTPAWFSALRATYGYEPAVFSTSPPECPVESGLAFCFVKSWLTGSRLVSMPFADHCQPLLNRRDDRVEFGALLQKIGEQHRCDYIEVRSLTPNPFGAPPTVLGGGATFLHHTLDLEPTLPVLFNQLHKSCVQRKIRRAEKEGLRYSEGTSDSYLRYFYSLLVETRRRHGVPPQPFGWFRNLRDCFADAFKIRIAFRGGRPIASLLTFRHKTTEVYKYGGSNADFHNLGGMPFLFWQTIQRAKEGSALQLDLGRSDVDNLGLIAFKNHLGAVGRTLVYYRHPPATGTTTRTGRVTHSRRVAKIVAHAPSLLLRAAGKALYRHMG